MALSASRRGLAIAAISLGTVLTTIDGAIVNVALPTIARDLRVDNSAAVLVVTVYQLTLVMTLLPFSALGDKVGLKRLYQLGQVVFAVATLLCFFANSLPFLLVARAVQGLGAAATISVMSAMIRHIYPHSMLGRGLALNTVCATVSGALAPTAGGLILGIAPWPWVFAAGVPFALLSLVLGRSTLPDVPPHDMDYDGVGAFLCAVTFGLTISGLESGVHGGSPVVSAAITLAGLLFAILFVRHELAQSHPIMPLDLLRLPVVGLSCASSLAAFMAAMLLTLSMPFRLQHLYGFSPREIGGIMASWPVVMIVVAPASGVLSDRVPSGLLGAVGMAIAVAAMLLVAFLPVQPGMIDIGWRMALCGVGFGLFFTPNARLVIGSAPRHRAASAGGLISTARLTGQTLGATILAALLAFGIGEARGPALAASALAILAGIGSLARLNPALRLPSASELDAGAA